MQETFSADSTKHDKITLPALVTGGEINKKNMKKIDMKYQNLKSIILVSCVALMLLLPALTQIPNLWIYFCGFVTASVVGYYLVRIKHRLDNVEEFLRKHFSQF